MIKSRGQECAFKGEITAFLALTFMLILSIVAALIQSANLYATKHNNRIRTQIALESTFAEYSSELLNQYEIFSRFGASLSVLQNRLDFYGVGDMTHEIEKVEYLTDHSGRPFYEQAIHYAKNWLGLDEVMLGTTYEFSANEDIEHEERGVLESIQEFLEEEEKELPKDNNPIQSVQMLKNMSLLTLVAPEQEQLSNQTISLSELPSHRRLNKGNYEASSKVGTLDKPFFIAYLAEHFSHYKNEKENTSLSYECEYLIGGKKSDRANLEVVCKRILQIRMLANYGYLLTDEGKKTEAEVMAAALCTLAGAPQLTALVKHAILLVWAYGESIVDVRVLLKGKKSPFLKTKETWQLQLANLITLGTEHEVSGEKDGGRGLGYQDYLYGLLLLEKNETLSMRSLDLIESNLHIMTDQCMTKVKIKSQYTLWKGVNDEYTTSFAYQ